VVGQVVVQVALTVSWPVTTSSKSNSSRFRKLTLDLKFVAPAISVSVNVGAIGRLLRFRVLVVDTEEAV
jgi:hypothetical protein